MPDIIFDTQEAVPEGLREKAVQKDGKWKVGVVHESFRDNNIELKKQFDAVNGAVAVYKEKFGDDPTKTFEEFNTLRALKQKVDDGSLKGTEAITTEVEKRTKAAQEGFATQLQAEKAETQKAREQAQQFESLYKEQMIAQAVSAAIMDPANGANPAAIQDFLDRARRDFRVNKEGKIVRMDGDTMIYGASGEASESPKEWLAKVLKASPYLSKASAGAADGGEKKGGLGKTPEELARMSPAEKLREARRIAASR